MVPGPDPFHYLSPPDLSSGPKYISSLSSGPKYQNQNPSANLFPRQTQSKKKGQKKYGLLRKRPKQFPSRFHEEDYTTGFTDTGGLSPKVSGGQGKFITKHANKNLAKARESGNIPRPGFRKNLGGKLGGVLKHCERGECGGNSPRRAVSGKQRNRRRQRKKNKKHAHKRQNGVLFMEKEQKAGVMMDDMMDIRELQHHQQQNREHGREMVDYPSSLHQKTASSSSSSPGSLSSSEGDQLELPFLSSYPRASTIEQLIGDPLDGWDIHMPNSEFFEDNE